MPGICQPRKINANYQHFCQRNSPRWFKTLRSVGWRVLRKQPVWNGFFDFCGFCGFCGFHGLGERAEKRSKIIQNPTARRLAVFFLFLEFGCFLHFFRCGKSPKCFKRLRPVDWRFFSFFLNLRSLLDFLSFRVFLHFPGFARNERIGDFPFFLNLGECKEFFYLFDFRGMYRFVGFGCFFRFLGFFCIFLDFGEM